MTLLWLIFICVFSRLCQSFQSVPPVEIVEESNCPWTTIRIPSFAKPLHYELYLHPNITTLDFKGKTSLFFKLIQPTKFIILHSKGLQVEEIGLKLKSKQTKKLDSIKIAKVIHCSESDLLYIETKEELSGDQTLLYKLFITYSRKLSDEALEGLYISSYNTSSIIDPSFEVERKLASTQFEPTSAREAFPCFDEPTFKATFTVKIVHEPRHNVFSNTFITSQGKYLDGDKDGLDDKHDENEENDNYGEKSVVQDLLVSTFEKTVKMSTYLVAIVVCEFSSEKQVSEKGKHTIHVLAPQDQMGKMKFALQTGTKLVDHFDDFFGIKYPLSKLDLVAIPSFANSAMENWGIITFAVEAIMYDPSEESVFDKEMVVITIAHEMAHQWFGNLVTMTWWEDLWLNEGFATYMSMVGAESLYPDWMTSGQFLTLVTQQAMIGDSSRFTHPIQNEIKHPDEIFAAFDSITYDKTAAIIRYLSSIIGMDNLKTGLRSYMVKYQYSNTVSNNLWSMFGENVTLHVDGCDYQIEEIMNSWVKQKGFPVLDVKVIGDKVIVEQNIFHQYPSLEKSSPEGKQIPKWFIRLDYVTNKNPEKMYQKWMSTSQVSFKSLEIKEADWFKINIDSAGFYRVNYDAKNWIKLIKMLKSLNAKNPAIKLSDRAGLIDDVFSLMKSGHVKPGMAMQLVTYLEHHEHDFVPWNTGIRQFEDICSKLGPNCPVFRIFLKKIIKPAIDKIGFQDTGTHLEGKLRSVLLNQAVCLNHSRVIEHFKKEFDEWKSRDDTRVNPNLKLIIISAGVKFGDEEDWNFIWDKFQKAKSPAEKGVYLEALGRHSPSDVSVNKILNAILGRDTGSSGHEQERKTFLISLMKNELVISGQINLWSWLMNNFEQLTDLLSKHETTPCTEIIEIITGPINTEEELTDVISFLEGKEKRIVIDRIREKIEGNIYWKKVIEPKILEWLNVYEKKNRL